MFASFSVAPIQQLRYYTPKNIWFIPFSHDWVPKRKRKARAVQRPSIVTICLQRGVIEWRIQPNGWHTQGRRALQLWGSIGYPKRRRKSWIFNLGIYVATPLRYYLATWCVKSASARFYRSSKKSIVLTGSCVFDFPFKLISWRIRVWKVGIFVWLKIIIIKASWDYWFILITNLS